MMLDLSGKERDRLRNELSETQTELAGLKEYNHSLRSELARTKESMTQALLEKQKKEKAAQSLEKEAEELRRLNGEHEKNGALLRDTLAEKRDAILESFTDLAQQLESIASNEESSDAVQAFIDSFSDNLEEIQGFAKVIKEVSDQTSLLAVNATIESAKAGEQGRGFSIVAEEIGKLSAKTENVLDELGVQLKMIRSEFYNHAETIQRRRGECDSLVSLRHEFEKLETLFAAEFAALAELTTVEKLPNKTNP